MKKKVVIGATLIALALSVSLLTVSVLAAMGQVFGVNNKIVFLGIDEYIHCIIEATITGTTKDGSSNLKHTWEYDYSDPNKDDAQQQWNIAETLEFNQNGVAPGSEKIVYSFKVENKSDKTKIRVYISDPTLDDEVLKYEVDGGVGSEKEIAPNGTATVTLKLMPKGEFSGARACDFVIHVETV